MSPVLFRSLFLLLLTSCGGETSRTGAATLTVTDRVALTGVKRFGMNLTENTFWGSGQISKNLVRANPGFEGWLYGSVVKVTVGGANTFTGEHGGGWKDGFWDGADYEVIQGPARGRKGKITHFTGPTNQSGAVWACDGRGAAFAAGSLVVLRGEWLEPAHAGWGLQKGGGGRVETLLNEARPGSPGTQSVKLIVPAAGDWSTLHAYFDSLNQGGHPFLSLNGRYRLEFWARGEAAGGVSVDLRRLLDPARVFFKEHFVPSSSWKHYRFEFDAENDTLPGTLDLGFAPRVGHLQLDDVALYKIEAGNDSAFRGDVVSTLEGMSPGILRFWAGQLGDTLSNATALPFAQKRTGFSRWSQEPKSLGYTLPEFLHLCRVLKAEPWYVLPITFSEQEMANLIEYLAAPADTVWGRLRADAGQAAPWTEVFSKIHLEFGNEAWNGIFSGGTIEDPNAYGQRAATLFAAARRNSFFRADQFQLIMGGQAGWPERNQKIVAAGGHETLSIAPYLMHKAPEGNADELIQALFSEVIELAEKGFVKRNKALVDKAPLCVYEVNLHTTEGPTSSQDLDAFLPSAGAGIAVACHMMNLLAEFQIRDQCFYNLSQYDYRRADGKRAKLWGAVRDMGSTYRKRPQYLAMVLCNRALLGNLLETQATGSFVPARKQGVDRFRAFAFGNGNQSSLLVFNLNQVAVNFRLELAKNPTGPVTKTSLNYGSLTDTNEEQERVTLLEQPDPEFRDGSQQTLGPGSMTLWTW